MKPRRALQLALIMLFVLGQIAPNPAREVVSTAAQPLARSAVRSSANDTVTSCAALTVHVFLPLIMRNGNSALAATTVNPAQAARVAAPADFASATAFLYTGRHPRQTGMAPNVIDPRRAAALRGQVCTASGQPIAGVQITILNHPEYGSTLTGGDGLFDLAVNGGGLITVVYTKTAYLPAQRQVQAPWQDYAWLPDLVMLPLDAQVTTIDLNMASMQVARGSLSSDGDGDRRATLLIPTGTQAALVFPNGVTQTITSLSVRATEYTVGRAGPLAMPAELPPSSGYTYAVEYSVDEGLAAGATGVQFNQPLIHYVENFLGFPTGMAVPAGYYDKTTATWIPADNGVVIKIVSISGGLANLDTTGSGAIDNGAALGVTTDERQRLATLYTAGQSLWRVPITHFTPWDFNWPYGPPPDAKPPHLPPPDNNPPPDKPDCQGGSVIECQSQILGEQVAVDGTPFTLNYRSDRVPGRKAAYTLDIPLRGASVPSSLTGISLVVEVAGRNFSYPYIAREAPSHLIFTWDGLDAYGRAVMYKVPVTTRIGYTYHLVRYKTPAQFKQSFGIVGVLWAPFIDPNNFARQDITLWQEWHGTLGMSGEASVGLGGWSLNVHHIYDPSSKTLYLGDGTRRSTDSLGSVIGTAAGTGAQGYNGDGLTATQAQLFFPSGVAVGPDGSLYIADSDNNRIRRVSPDGIITTVAGTGTGGYNGDGIPAAQAWLWQPNGVAIGPDGSLYIADTHNDRVRRVGPDGIITTVAGTDTNGYNGDGIPAALAQLSHPYGVAVGSDGSLYIADTNNSRIRRVGPNGIITTMAGNGTGWYNGDGIPAPLAEIWSPSGVAVGPDGSLYIADTGNDRIRLVGPDGMIRTVAGTGTEGYNSDGIPAIQAQLNLPYGVATGPDGSLYIADTYNHRIRLVGSDGIITTLAGFGTNGYNGDSLPATQAQLNLPYGVAMGPDGSLYIADFWNERIRRVHRPLPEFGLGDVWIAAEDSSEVYQFNASGRHLQTLDALTGAVRYQFGYDSALHLTSVTDGSGNVTTIQHDASGHPTTIIGPYGQQTNLAVNANGHLSSITAPGNRITQLATTSDGLLTSLTDPRGNTHHFAYDSLGLLIRDDDPAGGFKTLALTAAGQSYTVTLSTALNRTTIYHLTRPATGGDVRADTLPSGLQSLSTRTVDGSSTTRTADGTTAAEILGPDPRWGMLASLPTSAVITTPLGLTTSTVATRTATLTDTNNLLSLNTLVETDTLNGNSYVSTYDGASRTITRTTPTGRVTNATLDAQGRPVLKQVGGLFPISYTYDSHGRLSTVSQGTGANSRTATFAYDSNGNLATITDPLGRTTNLAYDAAGRVTTQTLPDGRVTGYAYDGNGNLTALTAPGRPAHTFSYTPIDLLATYTPPDVGTGSTSTAYTYNTDQQLTQMTRPDGRTVNLGYDLAGRTTAITLTRGAIGTAYDIATSNVATVTSPGGLNLAYTFDGSLLTGESLSGPINGTIAITYDNNLRVSNLAVNSDAIGFSYDGDGLMVQAGALELTRDPQNGLLRGSTLGGVTNTIRYNGFGEPVGYSAAYSSTALLDVQYARDPLGRIAAKTETISGATTLYSYTYDLAGRLTGVMSNGVRIEAYSYDSNGNYLSVTSPSGVITGTYDAQDRLLHYGAASYGYSANGELLTRTVGSQTTIYQYDELGNLLAVSLPNGTQISYIVDGQNRRIGKRVNGALVQGWLYEDSLRPAAELDGSGNVVARFIYATRVNVPDYMVKNGVTYRLILDHLGSPRLVVNTVTGQIAQRMDYDTFGRVLLDTNPGFQPFGFAGGLYDTDTNLIRFEARDYDVETGRWTARDPILYSGGQANLYTYAENDPVNLMDPFGLCGPDPDPCSPYTTGHRAELYWICSHTPNRPWWNCVRKCLLASFDPTSGTYIDPMTGDHTLFGTALHLTCFSICPH